MDVSVLAVVDQQRKQRARKMEHHDHVSANTLAAFVSRDTFARIYSFVFFEQHYVPHTQHFTKKVNDKGARVEAASDNANGFERSPYGLRMRNVNMNALNERRRLLTFVWLLS